MPNVTENTQIYKFNGTGYDIAQFSADNPPPGWAPNLSLAPGEGAFLSVDPNFNPVSGLPITLVGEVKLVSAVPIPNGFSIISSVIPQSDTLDNLGFPTRENDQAYFYNPVTKGYDIYQYSADNPPPGWSPSSPTPAVGQSFFFSGDKNFGPNRTWNRTFSVGP